MCTVSYSRGYRALNTDIAAIADWATENGLKLKPGITRMIQLGRMTTISLIDIYKLDPVIWNGVLTIPLLSMLVTLNNTT